MKKYLAITLLAVSLFWGNVIKAAESPLASTKVIEALADTFTFNSDGTFDISNVNDLTVDGSILANTGILTLGGTGGTNNEKLTFDFETAANSILLSSPTGLILIDFQTISINQDDNAVHSFGSSEDVRIKYDDGVIDSFQMGLMVGSDASSGYCSIMERPDLGNANREPAANSANPVLRIYSSDATEALDYIESFHDQTNGIIDVQNGDLVFGTNTLNLGIGNGVAFATETNTLAVFNGISPSGTANQSYLYARDVSSSSEMFAMDEGGDEAQLTGNTSEYPSDMAVSANYPYVNPKNQIYAGVKTYIAENKALELLQQLARDNGLLAANEYIIKHTTFTPSHNWENNQERQRLAREQQIQHAQDKNVELDNLIAGKITEIDLETDLGKKLKLINERNELQSRGRMVVPDEFIKINPSSQWLMSKGVKLQ